LIIDDRKPFAAPPGRPFHVLATFQRAGLDGVLVRLLERGPGRPGAAPARG
jgi:hypothetical protein